MPAERQTEESDLSLIGRALRRRIWVIALCVVAATLAAIGMTLLAEKEYSATAALLSLAPAEVDAQRVVDTNLQLLSLPVIAERTAEAVPGMTKEDVANSVETKQQGESDIILVRATASDPELAAELANVFAREFIAFRGGAPQGDLQTGRTELVDRATPQDTPVAPKPVRNVVFGALIGLVLGIGMGLILEQLDKRVKRKDDLTEATGLSLLASIPRREAFDRDHLGSEPLSLLDTEVFRMLRASLRYFKVGQDVKSVLVTSAEPGEGKTLVSLGLALGSAASGERVLMLEADMRDPGLAEILGLPRAAGLSEMLSSPNSGSVSEAAISVKASALAESVGDKSIDVLQAGAVPPNPTELIESQKMRDLVAEAEAAYDFVVIDTPPALVVSDAIPLISFAGAVLAVSGLGVSTHNSAVELADLLERLDARTLGLVANFSEQEDRAYGDYGYGRRPQLDVASLATNAQPRERSTTSRKRSRKAAASKRRA